MESQQQLSLRLPGWGGGGGGKASILLLLLIIISVSVFLRSVPPSSEFQSGADAPCPSAGLSDLLLPSRHPRVNIILPPSPPQSRQSPSHLPLCFWKSCTPPSQPPHSFLLSPVFLLTGCHVRQPSPRQCLAFLSPLTAAAVKPPGFCTDRNLRVGVKTGAADVCLPHAPVCLIPTRQQGCFFFSFHSRTAEQMRRVQPKKDPPEGGVGAKLVICYWAELRPQPRI